MESDEELSRAVAAGDQRALGVLYERHAAAMLRLIRRLIQNAAVAEEILQEAWLAVWRAAGTFRGESSVRGWLLGVARRQAHDKLRRAEVSVVPLTIEAETTPDSRIDVEAQVLARIAHDDGRALLDHIDAEPWSTDLRRRVQHYGYRYDYGRRTVATPAGRSATAIPVLALALAVRLRDEGYTDRPADQVIVNEYLPGQGISAHVDCVPWRHAIAARKSDPTPDGRVVRGRRVSVTFRTVV